METDDRRRDEGPPGPSMEWRTFVLYCHIAVVDEKRLGAIRNDIRALLKEHHGLLVLFVDTGLADLLQMIRPIRRGLSRDETRRDKQTLKEDFRQRSQPLRDSETFGASLEAILGADVRVLTPLDLVDVFGEMTEVDELKEFLVGTQGEIRYDTPKFVESIVRLRMIGSRVPVLRLDRDVLIPPEGESFNKQALALAIWQIRDAVVAHHDSTQILATILSANYETPMDDDPDVMDWNRGFATRILPSLRLPTDRAAAKYLAAPSGVTNWARQLQNHFRPELTKRFLDSLWEWGAPSTAVISGALLYMNDAVVLNVPPFSNFSQMVMWIDDHLRYVLHREMGDFCRQTQVAFRTREPLHVFYEDVRIAKYRVAENFLAYTVRTYLPSLLWGSFFDYWLCPAAILKKRQEQVAPEERLAWEAKRRDGSPGVLTQAVREARAGCLPDAGKLREDLKAAANDRLATLRAAWGGLKTGRSHTIASAWVADELPRSLKEALKQPAALGLPAFDTKLPEKVEEFQYGLKVGFDQLLDDSCRYVKWVFEWPHVVSVIRSVPPGEFRSDLGWKPPQTERTRAGLPPSAPTAQR